MTEIKDEKLKKISSGVYDLVSEITDVSVTTYKFELNKEEPENPDANWCSVMRNLPEEVCCAVLYNFSLKKALGAIWSRGIRHASRRVEIIYDFNTGRVNIASRD